MRPTWLIAAFLLSPVVSIAKPATTLGVGELSCSKEIQEPLCAKLTEGLVAALKRRSERPVVRQSEARMKQRACNQDPECMVKNRATFERVVSGTVRAGESGVEISLRLLDAKRMEKLAESSARAKSARESELMAGVESAAAELSLAP